MILALIAFFSLYPNNIVRIVKKKAKKPVVLGMAALLLIFFTPSIIILLVKIICGIFAILLGSIIKKY